MLHKVLCFEDRHVVIWYRNMEESLSDMSLHL